MPLKCAFLCQHCAFITCETSWETFCTVRLGALLKCMDWLHLFFSSFKLGWVPDHYGNPVAWNPPWGEWGLWCILAIECCCNLWLCLPGMVGFLREESISFHIWKAPKMLCVTWFFKTPFKKNPSLFHSDFTVRILTERERCTELENCSVKHIHYFIDAMLLA